MKTLELQKHRSQLLDRLKEIDQATAHIRQEIAQASETQTSFLQDGLDHAKEQSDLSARFEIYEKYMNCPVPYTWTGRSHTSGLPDFLLI